MEATLGRDAAHSCVREALDKANRAMVAKRGALLDIPTLDAEFAGFGEGVRYEFETVESPTPSSATTVHPLRLRRVHEEHRAQDLGELLILTADYAMADELGLTLERTTTAWPAGQVQLLLPGQTRSGRRVNPRR